MMYLMSFGHAGFADYHYYSFLFHYSASSWTSSLSSPWPPTATENATNKMVHLYETNDETSKVKTRLAGSSAALLLLQLRVNVAAASTTTWNASHLYSAGASPLCRESSGAPKKGEEVEIETAHVPAARSSSEGDVFVRTRQIVDN